MTIGERIKYLRESQGMTQKKLADSIHVSASLMNRIEKGSSNPNLDCICNIAGALKLTPKDILCDIFIYPDKSTSVPEQIKIEVEKFSQEKQKVILETLQFLSSRLK